MAFLKSAWYCVGHAHELLPRAGDGSDGERRHVKAITVLGEPLVLWRRADGELVALQDRCPHRFAPLSLGVQVGDELQCPYHGLRFDAAGRCSHNPHGDQSIPKAAQVRAYPVLERHGLMWVWMGEAAEADPAKLPDFSVIDRRPGWGRCEGSLRVRANYQLVVDNLLDLSHVNYLHPFLASKEPPLPDLRVDIRMTQQDDTVVAINELIGAPNSALFKLLWEHGEPPTHVHMRANMRWDAPSLLLLDTGGHRIGEQREDGVSVPSAHLLTPESEHSTHYFWVVLTDRHAEDAAVLDQIAQGVAQAFEHEDEPMIEAVSERMGGADLWSLRPVLLSGDAAAVRARRTLAARIEAEQARGR